MAIEPDQNQLDHVSPSDVPPNVVAPSDPASLAWRIANLRRYDLNLLLSLHALLHTRNVTLAGDWLGVTQPAMSTDLRRLRQMFGDELLVRVGREYHLTAQASALVEPLMQAVVDIERTLKWRPGFNPACEAREFTIALSDHILALILHPLAAGLPIEAPNITLHTRGLSGLATDPVGATLRGEVDLSIGAFRQTEHACAEVLYQSIGIQRQVPLTTESFALLPYLLRGTRLVALVHERLARRFDGLKLLEPPAPIPDVVETMYWSAAVAKDPGHIWLRQLARDIAQTL